jgi:hypothetical protein
MSSDRGAGETRRMGSPPARMVRVWRDLPHERRLAAFACLGLFLTLFLPWYQETVFANGVSALRSASSSLTGWGAFSFVEAAVLLVAASVLLLLFVRAEGQAFHVPGGDGGVITAAGLWTCVLIVWRIFDKQGTSRHGQVAYTSGIEWGIFVALAVGALLAYAGSLIRLAHEPEPPLPGESEPADTVAQRPQRRGWTRRKEEPRRRAAPRTYPGPDMGADDGWTQEVRVRRASPAAPPARPEPSEAPTQAEAPTWADAPTQAEARTQADPAEAPTRRVRPRSIAAAGEAPARPAPRPAPAPPPETPAAPESPPPPDPPTQRRRRPLSRREIQEIELEEPPTARLSRSAPAQPRVRPEPEPEPEPEPPTERQPPREDPDPDTSSEHLTIRMDRPD